MCIYLGKSAHEAGLADARISHKHNFKEKFIILHHIRTVLRSEVLHKTNDAFVSTRRIIFTTVHLDSDSKSSWYTYTSLNGIYFSFRTRERKLFTVLFVVRCFSAVHWTHCVPFLLSQKGRALNRNCDWLSRLSAIPSKWRFLPSPPLTPDVAAI